MSLAEPDAAHSAEADDRLDRVLVLLESMDSRLSRLEAQVAHGTGTTAPSSPDVLQVPARLSAALAEPDTVEALVRILDRLDHIDQSLVAMAQLPDLAAGAVDTVDRVMMAAGERKLARSS